MAIAVATALIVIALVAIAAAAVFLIRRERKRRRAVADALQEVLETYQPFRDAMDDLTTTAYDRRLTNYSGALIDLHRAANHDRPADSLVASTAGKTLPAYYGAPFERGKVESYYDLLRRLVWPKGYPTFADALAAHQRQTVASAD